MTKSKTDKYTLDDKDNSYLSSKKYDKLLKHASKKDEEITSFSVKIQTSKHNTFKATLALQGIQLTQAMTLFIDYINSGELKIVKKPDNTFALSLK